MNNTIAALCAFINYLDDQGCLTEEDKAEYKAIMAEYNQERAEYRERIEDYDGE